MNFGYMSTSKFDLSQDMNYIQVIDNETCPEKDKYPLRQQIQTLQV